jgi:hypothetical protein
MSKPTKNELAKDGQEAKASEKEIAHGLRSDMIYNTPRVVDMESHSATVFAYCTGGYADEAQKCDWGSSGDYW